MEATKRAYSRANLHGINAGSGLCLFNALALALMATCPVSSAFAEGQIQVSDARAAYTDSISAPIAPEAEPAPVKNEQAAGQGAGTAGGDTAKVEIRSVAFDGNTVFSDSTLTSLVSGSLQGGVTFAQLQALAEKVQNFYHDHGYRVARVIIPKQDIGAERKLTFLVLEGHVDHVEVPEDTRFSKKSVTKTLAYHGIHEGAPFKLADLEQALIRLNDLSGITASSTLKAGDSQGSTRVLVDIKDEPRVSGSIEVNNFGNENTGNLRIVPSVTMADLTGRGDELSVYGVVSPEHDGLYFGQVNYSAPVGNQGWGVATYASAGNYDVGGEYEVLNIEGNNYAFGLGGTYEWILSSRTKLNFESWFEMADKEQDILGEVSSKDKIRKVSFGANLDSRNFNGRTYASLHLSEGLGEILGAMHNDSALSSRSFAHGDNTFTKVELSVTRLQSLIPNLFLVGHLAAQYSFDSLVSGEQIFIGGANSVRGHPESTYGGDDGFVANLEARWTFIPGCSDYQLAAFIDHGEVHVKYPVTNQDSWNGISGAGIGLRATPIKNLELRTDVAVPVGGRTEDNLYVYAQARYRF